MSRTLRLWFFILLAALVVLMLPSLLITPGVAPAIAQGPTAAATPEPTKTTGEVVGGETWSWLVELWERFGWWALAFVLITVIVALVVAFGKGLLGGAEEEGKRTFQQLARRAGSLSGQDRAIRDYLAWLRREYGRLPVIGVATEQVQLTVESVHVPLRVVERGEAEAHQRRMRGEEPAEEEVLRLRRVLGDLPSRDDPRILKLLSDPAELERRRLAYERRLAWVKRLPEPVRRFLANEDEEQTAKRPSAFEEEPPNPFVVQQGSSPRLLLLGGAGSGKTMTLRYAALRCAAAYEGHKVDVGEELGLYLRQPPLPIYVRLTLFAQTLPDDVRQLPAAEREQLAGARCELFLGWLARSTRLPLPTLEGLLDRGRCLLLLDGLDESGSEEHRAYIVEVIDDLSQRYADNRFVVASRTAGYGGRVQLASFTERHLRPLDDDEAHGLIRKWFAAVDARQGEGHDSGADEQTERLWDIVSRNPRLLEMASNPLLATTMALLQFNNIRLPDQRAKLYEKLVELLLDLWRKTTVNNDTLRRGVAQLSTEQRRVERLALMMQLQPTQAREVALRQAQEWLLPLYLQANIDVETAKGRIATLLESLSIDSGLVQRTQRGERVYSFSHYTFQEYLAARGLDALEELHPGDELIQLAGCNNGVAFLLDRSGDGRWRETLLLAAGKWSNDQQLPKTMRLLRGLLDQRTPAATILAGAALADIGPVEELTTLRSEVAHRLSELAFDPIVCPEPRQRNEAANLLDRQGEDRRLELNPTHEGYWARKIEPCWFMMGPAPEIHSGQSLHQAFPARIERPYALALFPVTNALYKRFLETLGISDRMKRRPHDWPGHTYRPGEGQHPVVGVTWYDAAFFAAWLDEDLRNKGILKNDESIRLPLETEWERAAAYPVEMYPGYLMRGQRIFPWGNSVPTIDGEGGLLVTSFKTADVKLREMIEPANTRESGIGGTSAVGIFPNGRADCGADDMTGNV